MPDLSNGNFSATKRQVYRTSFSWLLSMKDYSDNYDPKGHVKEAVCIKLCEVAHFSVLKYTCLAP